MNVSEEMKSLRTQIDGLLALPSMTPTQRKQCDLLLSKVSSLRGQEERQNRATAALAECGVVATNEEQREEYKAAKYEGEFRNYLNTGRVENLRTYTPMVSGDVPLSQNFLSAYREALISSSGIRAAGSTVITTKNGDSMKAPFLNDTSNLGELLAENATSSLANPTFSDVVLSAFRFGSKGLKYSAQLSADAGIDITTMLATTLGKRIARITNNYYTLGNVSAMAGVVPSISAIVTASSSTGIALSDLVEIQGQVDPAYLPSSVYQMNNSTLRYLKKVEDSAGHRMYPELSQPQPYLLGFPVITNVDLPNIASAAKTIIFGSAKLGITIREELPTLLISAERFAESHSMYAVLMTSSDCQVTDASALAVLQQAT